MLLIPTWLIRNTHIYYSVLRLLTIKWLLIASSYCEMRSPVVMSLPEKAGFWLNDLMMIICAKMNLFIYVKEKQQTNQSGKNSNVSTGYKHCHCSFATKLHKSKFTKRLQEEPHFHKHQSSLGELGYIKGHNSWGRGANYLLNCYIKGHNSWGRGANYFVTGYIKGHNSCGKREGQITFKNGYMKGHNSWRRGRGANYLLIAIRICQVWYVYAEECHTASKCM